MVLIAELDKTEVAVHRTMLVTQSQIMRDILPSCCCAASSDVKVKIILLGKSILVKMKILFVLKVMILFILFFSFFSNRILILIFIFANKE